MDYKAYLPDINVADGKARVMGNLKLYLRLLGRFDGAKLAGNITCAINDADEKAVIQAAHALRGTAANLAFPVVQQVAEEIESLTKAGESCAHLTKPLNEAVTSLSAAIGRLLEEVSKG